MEECARLVLGIQYITFTSTSLYLFCPRFTLWYLFCPSFHLIIYAHPGKLLRLCCCALYLGGNGSFTVSRLKRQSKLCDALKLGGNGMFTVSRLKTVLCLMHWRLCCFALQLVGNGMFLISSLKCWSCNFSCAALRCSWVATACSSCQGCGSSCLR